MENFGEYSAGNISESSGGYESGHGTTIERERNAQPEKVFGGLALEHIAMLFERRSESRKNDVDAARIVAEKKEEALRADSVRAILKESRIQLLLGAEQSHSPGAGIFFFAQALAVQPRLREELAFLAPDRGGGMEHQLLNSVMQIPDGPYLEMLLVHAEKFAEKNERLLGESPRLKYEFIERVSGLIRTGQLPLDPGRVRERLDRVSVLIGDSLVHELPEILGGFAPEKNALYISGEAPEDWWEEIYTHEAFHALAGRTNAFYQFKDAEYGGADPMGRQTSLAMPHRNGLRITMGFKDRFVWLNEAITQTLTLKVLGKKSGIGYEDYIRLFEDLRTKGKKTIPLKVFLHAYSENFDTVAEKAAPGWRELSVAAAEAYDSGFLVRLDEFVKSQGAEAAQQTLRADWDRI